MSRFEQARSSLALLVLAAFIALLAGVAFSLWSSTEGPDREPTTIQTFQDRPTTRTAMEELSPLRDPATDGVDSESTEETPGPSSPPSSADLTQAISDERELLRTVGRMSVDELIESELVNPHGIELSKLERRWLQSLMDQEQLAVEVAWTEFGEVKHQLVRRLRDSGEFERIEGHPKRGRPEPTRPGQITMYSLKDGVLAAVRIDPDRFPELDRAQEVGWQASVAIMTRSPPSSWRRTTRARLHSIRRIATRVGWSPGESSCEEMW